MPSRKGQSFDWSCGVACPFELEREAWRMPTGAARRKPPLTHSFHANTAVAQQIKADTVAIRPDFLEPIKNS
jgi:hypothetical protein